MVNLNDLDMAEVREHYLLRERVHRRLRDRRCDGHDRRRFLPGARSDQ